MNPEDISETEVDFVIKELDVFLAKSSMNNLYLFQVTYC
jgi:hypothetical protein